MPSKLQLDNMANAVQFAHTFMDDDPANLDGTQKEVLRDLGQAILFLDAQRLHAESRQVQFMHTSPTGERSQSFGRVGSTEQCRATLFMWIFEIRTNPHFARYDVPASPHAVIRVVYDDASFFVDAFVNEYIPTVVQE